MRTLITFIFSVLILTITAQEYKGIPLEYGEVIKQDSILKGELYKRAKLFFVNSFKNSKNIIQLDDSDSGIIVGNVEEHFKEGDMYILNISYTLSIAVKDGRYKYEIKDILLKGQRWSDFYKDWVPYYNDIITNDDLGKSYYEELRQKNKRIKPDSTYIYYRDKAKELCNNIIILIKENMLNKSVTSETSW